MKLERSQSKQSCEASHFSGWGEQALAWWRYYNAPFLGAYALTLIAYSYLFTTIIFTNHTLPNVWLRSFPSYYTTFSEGRWFNDVIYAFVGVGGAQSFQMAIACGIQIVNGFLFAALLGVTRRWYIFLIAAFVSLYPAILDYYSFTSDHIAFVVGDTFALLGVLALDRMDGRKAPVGVAALCFLLCLATYQPKIALIAVLLLMWCIRGTLDRRDIKSMVVERVVPASMTFALAVIAYYVSTRLIIVSPQPRTHINDLYTFLQQVLQAYPEVWRYFTKADYLPRPLQALPLLGIALGSIALVWQVRKNGWSMISAVLVLLAAFPLALQLSYLINDATWRNTGRILAAHAYFVLFFLASAWALPRLRVISMTIMGVMLYYFVIVAAQETNAAALKTVYDLQKLNRIVARVESLIPPGGVSVVAIGSMANKQFSEYGAYPNTLYRPHLKSDTFAPYRQVGILNFLLGRDLLRAPTRAQVGAAVASAEDRDPWPSPKSVYVHDGILVVLLSRYKPGAAATWSLD